MNPSGAPDCGDCVYSQAITDGRGQRMLECRRFPPQLHVIPVPSKVIGQAPMLMKQSGFPNCIDPCGEFRQFSSPIIETKGSVGR
jgi:hypothetical protein